MTFQLETLRVRIDCEPYAVCIISIFDSKNLTCPSTTFSRDFQFDTIYETYFMTSVLFVFCHSWRGEGPKHKNEEIQKKKRAKKQHKINFSKCLINCSVAFILIYLKSQSINTSLLRYLSHVTPAHCNWERKKSMFGYTLYITIWLNSKRYKKIERQFHNETLKKKSSRVLFKSLVENKIYFIFLS